MVAIMRPGMLTALGVSLALVIVPAATAQQGYVVSQAAWLDPPTLLRGKDLQPTLREGSEMFASFFNPTYERPRVRLTRCHGERRRSCFVHARIADLRLTFWAYATDPSNGSGCCDFWVKHLRVG